MCILFNIHHNSADQAKFFCRTAVAGLTKFPGIPSNADVFAAVAVCNVPGISAAAFASVVTDVFDAVEFLRVPAVAGVTDFAGVTVFNGVSAVAWFPFAWGHRYYWCRYGCWRPCYCCLLY